VAELDHGARSLSRSVDQLTGLTLTLRGAAARLRSRLDDDRIDSTTTDLARTARSLTGASADLRAASTSLASILAKLDHGDGTLGRALNDPSLYQALLTAAGHADEAATGATELVRDVRARPGRYLNMSLF
jgi:phospholipid/cholesterol/gamma-HCH transport system substrate-binding protein